MCVHLPSFLLGGELGRRVAGSYYNFCLLFWEPGKLLAAVHSCQQCFSVPVSSTPAISCYFQPVDYIPLGIKWHIIVVLICISLVINVLEKFFMYLLAIFMSSLEQCLFNYFALFFSYFYYWVFFFKYILNANPYQIYNSQYFLPLRGISWNIYFFKILMEFFFFDEV